MSIRFIVPVQAICAGGLAALVMASAPASADPFLVPSIVDPGVRCPYPVDPDGRCPGGRETMDAATCRGAIDGIAQARRSGDADRVVIARGKALRLGCLGR